jgi:hypothetical protein
MSAEQVKSLARVRTYDTRAQVRAEGPPHVSDKETLRISIREHPAGQYEWTTADRASSDDGLRVIDPSVPANPPYTAENLGRWKVVEESIQFVSDLSSPASLAWTLDPTSGDDNAPNGGTIKTAAEYTKRIRNAGGRVPGAVTVAQKGDLATTDRWDFTGISTGEAGSITVDGATGVVVASELAALSAAQSINLGNPTDCAQYVTINGQNWATLIDKQVRRKSDGAISYVSVDVTGGQARMAPFILNPTFNSSNVNPGAGDILQVLTLPKARNLVVATTNINLNFKNLDFDDFDGVGHTCGGAGFSAITFIACHLRGFFFYTQGISLYHCQSPSGSFIIASGNPALIVCGGHFGGGPNSFQMPHIAIDNHALFRGTNIRMFGAGAALMPSIGKVGVYGVAGGIGAVVAGQGAKCLFGNSLSGTSAIYGVAGYNCEARSGDGRIFYDNSQGEAAIFKVATITAKYLQGATTRTSLPAAVDASGNLIAAWT